jgi:hypothetical protein
LTHKILASSGRTGRPSIKDKNSCCNNQQPGRFSSFSQVWSS